MSYGCAFTFHSWNSSSPVAAGGPSQRCGLCCDPDSGEIHGFLFHQPAPLHPTAPPRGVSASAPSSSLYDSVFYLSLKKNPNLYFLHLLKSHAFSAPSVGRLVLLCQEEVSRAVRQQHLSEVWTVDYAQDMLLLGGLLPETVWLAYHLGDWKSAASLGLAFTNYCTGHFDFTRLRRREFHLPAELKPGCIFQMELQRLLGDTSDSRKGGDEDGDRNFTGWFNLKTK